MAMTFRFSLRGIHDDSIGVDVDCNGYAMLVVINRGTPEQMALSFAYELMLWWRYYPTVEESKIILDEMNKVYIGESA